MEERRFGPIRFIPKEFYALAEEMIMQKHLDLLVANSMVVKEGESYVRSIVKLDRRYLVFDGFNNKLNTKYYTPNTPNLERLNLGLIIFAET